MSMYSVLLASRLPEAVKCKLSIFICIVSLSLGHPASPCPRSPSPSVASAGPVIPSSVAPPIPAAPPFLAAPSGVATARPPRLTHRSRAPPSRRDSLDPTEQSLHLTIPKARLPNSISFPKASFWKASFLEGLES
ncbi:hypothetical protein GUJ93_ZPchr0010g7655 [Zizania palustris]|uniref:Uncharacterized protein n=1 Tax=Zizania palustris TaxID=103762 RepID=A0A8J5WFY8_ZIZPA|nr:hypothetical protein GUJ93_ZPchr0010g7655 [Zizania palustris]